MTTEMAKFGALRLVWLEAFVRVADSGKRTAAAAEMGIQQGTITKHVQKLEQWLGGRILLDDGVPVRLQPDGERFLPIARQILELLKEARTPPAAPETPPAPRVSAKDLRPPIRGQTPKDA